MSTLRLLVRSFVLAVGTVAIELVYLVCLGPAWLFGAALRALVAAFTSWARFAARVIGMRVEIEGHPPRRGGLLVSNHVSYVDILLLAHELPCVFVSKSEVAHWPLAGWLSRSVGTIFVDREKKRELTGAAQEIRERLESGDQVVLFPEGTSGAGDVVMRFRSSLLAPAAELGIPVSWAALRYATKAGEKPAHLSVSWWGTMGFLPHLADLLRLSGFEARLCFGAAPIRETDRKVLAQRLHAAVAERFVPMTSAPTHG
jgi:1-acyl-sn-glycerol-3-phosphate acyltransferase